MNLAMLSAVLVLLLCIGVILTLLSNNKKQAAKLKLGLALIVHMQKIISCCQQHRGISNAILQGNKSLKIQLISIQSQLDKLITEGHALGLNTFPQWQSFIGHWPRLKMHALDRDLTSQNLLRQHNLMIHGHLSLVDDLMSYHDLTWIMVGSSLHLSQLCLDTLKVVETIAQSRGIGAGICARGECQGIDKISLDFLRISIISPTNELLTELGQIEDDLLLSQLSSSSILIRESVDNLISIIENKVLIEGKIDIDTGDFFKMATRPIDGLVTVYQNLIAHAVRTV